MLSNTQPSASGGFPRLIESLAIQTAPKIFEKLQETLRSFKELELQEAPKSPEKLKS